jgi:hypothetical protein
MSNNLILFNIANNKSIYINNLIINEEQQNRAKTFGTEYIN